MLLYRAARAARTADYEGRTTGTNPAGRLQHVLTFGSEVSMA